MYALPITFCFCLPFHFAKSRGLLFLLVGVNMIAVSAMTLAAVGLEPSLFAIECDITAASSLCAKVNQAIPTILATGCFLNLNVWIFMMWREYGRLEARRAELAYMKLEERDEYVKLRSKTTWR